MLRHRGFMTNTLLARMCEASVTVWTWFQGMSGARHDTVEFMLVLLVALVLLVPQAIAQPAAPGAVAGLVRVVSPDGRFAPPGPVIVFVEDLQQPFPPPAPLEIRQRDKQFQPQLLLVPQGSTVAFPNDDAVDHNVFSLSPVTPFDLGYFESGVSRQVKFDRPGAVRVYCNIHSSMIADVLVLPNPFYARVSADGTYRVDGVPAGLRRLRAWFPHGPSQGKSVTVSAGAAATADFRLQSTVVTAHENKHGEPYFLDYPK